MKKQTAYILFFIVMILNILFLLIILNYTITLFQLNEKVENNKDIVCDDKGQGISTAFPEKFLNFRKSKYYLNATGVCE
jgi:hypothetical protein